MRLEPSVVHADLVVVGSGVAGLSAALAAADAGASVALLTSGDVLSGSSPNAQGGIAAALGDDDTPTLHAEDTRAVGAGLNDRRAVDVLVTAGKVEVEDLIAAGVPFDGDPFHPALGLEAGHRRRRIVHANGAATGHAVTSALLARATSHQKIALYAHVPAEALHLQGSRVAGVRSGTMLFRGRGVVLATGGYAALFARSTNAPESLGQGLAMAWEVGATLADLEFVQFHPTATAVPGYPAFLLSEALRGEGALLVDADGHAVVNPLLPRDQVARAIFRHRRDRGPVYLTLRHLDAESIRQHFSNLAIRLAEWNLDLARDPIPVAPAAHYCMGGIRTDEMGRSDVPGLYAAGESACTGAQGANRLASNSLLECLVFGRLAAQAVLEDDGAAPPAWDTRALPVDGGTISSIDDRPDAAGARAASGDDLDACVGVERDGEALSTLIDMLGPAPRRDMLVPALVARAALIRRESRGAHYRSDFPEMSEAYQGRILWQRGAAPRFEGIH